MFKNAFHRTLGTILFTALIASAAISNTNDVVTDDFAPATSSMTQAGKDKTVYRVRYFDKDAKSKFSAGPWFSDEKAYAKSRSLSQNNRIRLNSIRIQSLTPGNDSWQKVAD